MMTTRISPRWTVSSVLWIAVLAIMASFQAWRGAWVDAILFYAIVAVLVIDRLTGGTIKLIKQPLIVSKPVMLIAGGIATMILVIAPRHGVINFVVMVVIGLSVLLVAWQPQPEGKKLPARAYTRSTYAWAILAVALCVWEALAFIFSVVMPNGLLNYPTVSVLLDPLVENLWGRIFFVALWIAGGLALLGVWRKK